MTKMADARLTVCNALCFLLSKHGKTSVKVLKSVLLDFYKVEELVTAKQHLLSDINRQNCAVKPPHVPSRRDGDNRATHEVDDIMLLLTFLDENGLLLCVSKYVSDDPDNMPSTRLYEGDLKLITNFLAKMEERMNGIELRLASISHDMHSAINRPPLFSTPSRPVINTVTSQPDKPQSTIPTVTSGIPQVSVSTMSTSSTSTDALATTATAASSSSYAAHVTNGSRQPTNWAAVMTANLDAGSSVSQSESDQPFQEYSSSRSRRKRRRKLSKQSPQQLNQTAGPLQSTAVRDNQTARRRAPLMVGKSTTTQVTTCKIVAAQPMIKKAIFCVDNIDSSVSVDDIVDFVKTLSIDVISCFEAKSRRRLFGMNGESIVCKAFRLSIREESRSLLLNPDNWPEYVSISDWYFKVKQPAAAPQSAVHPAGNTATEVDNVDMDATILLNTDIRDIPESISINNGNTD